MCPKVSVIMPIYNAHDYLKKSLNDILRQTLSDIEIICVNDGSTDDSSEILAEFAAIDSRIHVINQENRGAGAARNVGLQYACGEYLSILDCDDFFEPDMLEKSYNAAKENHADMVVFGCDFYSNSTKQYSACNYSIGSSLLPDKNPFCADDIKKDVFKLFVGWSWDKLIRTEFVKKYGLLFQEQRTTNDALFVFSAIIKSERIYTLDEVLIHHRKADGTLSVTREKSWLCFYNMLVALRGQLEAWGLYERYEQDFINYCLHFSLWNLNTLCEPTRSMLYKKLKYELFDALSITGHQEDYFYNKYEYQQYKIIMDKKTLFSFLLFRARHRLAEKMHKYGISLIWNKFSVC